MFVRVLEARRLDELRKSVDVESAAGTAESLVSGLDEFASYRQLTEHDAGDADPVRRIEVRHHPRFAPTDIAECGRVEAETRHR